MKRPESIKDILWPVVFVAAMSYVIWNFPKFIVLFGWASDAMLSRHPTAGALDIFALAALFGSLVMGIRSTEATSMEAEIVNPFDRISLFLGRVTMLLIVLLVSVMFYEVVLRYVFERPTLWANELSLWLAGFVFLLAGLYAMQQRSHIRIYLLYDAFPRWLQRTCDTISTALIFAFAISMIWGGWNEARDKLLRWETFGTAFDPPIPATIKPMVLLVILLVALQALANLISDWNKEAEHHAVVDIEQEEIEELARQARAGARDV